MTHDHDVEGLIRENAALREYAQKADARSAALEADVAAKKLALEVACAGVVDMRKRAEQAEREREEERARLVLMRKLLWLRHGHEITSLYGDDGEMQCGICCVDFKRQEPIEIDAAFRRRAALAATTGSAPAI